MANFDESLKIVLAHEGGFVDNPDDHGGPTNFGLTLADLSCLGLNSTTMVLKNLSQDQVSAIYRKLFWEPLQGDLIVSQKVADLLFDQGVLNGIGTVVRFVQRIVGVPADGILGPQTLGKINTTSATRIEALFVAAELRRYVQIAGSNPSQMQFLRGWVNRSADLLERMFS